MRLLRRVGSGDFNGRRVVSQFEFGHHYEQVLLPLGEGGAKRRMRASAVMLPEPRPKENSIGGHAICIVGYDDAKRLLKFKNSWTTQWGDHGYGYISYSYFEKFSDDSWAIEL